MQMAIGILEQRADERQQAHIEDLREEVEHMSNLVNELLSISKASLKPGEVLLRPVQVAAIAAGAAVGARMDEFTKRMTAEEPRMGPHSVHMWSEFPDALRSEELDRRIYDPALNQIGRLTGKDPRKGGAPPEFGGKGMEPDELGKKGKENEEFGKKRQEGRPWRTEGQAPAR
jgi:hypothetical protein